MNEVSRILDDLEAALDVESRFNGGLLVPSGSSSRETSSRQPWRNADRGQLWRYWDKHCKEMPEFGADTRKLDTWLLSLVRQEPHLKGVLDTVTTIDANRHWLLTGGQGHVRRWQTLFTGAELSPSLSGWSSFFNAQSRSYWATCAGANIEFGRDPLGAIVKLFHIDPTKVQLQYDWDEPIRVDGVPFAPDGFMRLVSDPQVEDKYLSAGWSPVAAAAQTATLMMLVLQHQRQAVSPELIAGILTVNNMSQKNFMKAMEMKYLTDEAFQALPGAEFFRKMLIIANGRESVDVKLQAFSELPKDFDQNAFLFNYMALLSLLFKYDLREFWPGPSAPIGQATETQIQDQKATAKGNIALPMEFTRTLQNSKGWPDALMLEFAKFSTQGLLAHANVVKAYGEAAIALQNAGVDRGLALGILVRDRILPPEATDIIEPELITDTDPTTARQVPLNDLREKLLPQQRVRRAIELNQDAPIIQLEWPLMTERVVWQRGSDAYQFQARGADLEEDEAPITRTRGRVKLRTLDDQIDSYADTLAQLVDAAADGAEEAELADIIESTALAAGLVAWIEGQYGANADDWSDDIETLYNAAVAVISAAAAGDTATTDDADAVDDDAALVALLGADAAATLQEERDIAREFAGGMAAEIVAVLAAAVAAAADGDAVDLATVRGSLATRWGRWLQTARRVHNRAKLYVPGASYTWRRGGTEEPCTDCVTQDGQTRTAAEWRALGVFPRGRDLECGGWKCECDFEAA